MTDALKALRGLEQFFVRPGENSIGKFDRVAAQFYHETGMMAPGKDVSAASGDDSTDEQRREAFDAWVEGKAAAARAVIAYADRPKNEVFASELDALCHRHGVHLEGGTVMDREPMDDGSVYLCEYDGSLIKGGDGAERRNCDDCDYFTYVPDAMSCPHCSGSLA